MHPAFHAGKATIQPESKPIIDQTLKEIIIQNLECGDSHDGHVRIHGDACGTDRLLALCCKKRKIRSCGEQKWPVEFGQWLCGHASECGRLSGDPRHPP